MDIRIKRVYDPPLPSDGYRILVDRLWPRGVSKQHAALNAWMKDVAPSTQLREWFDHRTERFDEFRKKYTAELDEDVEKQPLIQKLLQQARQGTVTLLYGARSPNVNHAAVLRDYLLEMDAARK